MSQVNVELVRRGFLAAMDEDWPTALETLGPDVEVHDFHSGMELERLEVGLPD
jgi:hypothetical protein